MLIDPKYEALDKPLILPRAGCKDLLGIDETIITEDDMTTFLAWYNLAMNHDLYLSEDDFKDKSLFYKYWLLSAGLLEYPIILIHGLRGGGKSLIDHWLGFMKANLFKKNIVLEKPVPKPEVYNTKINFLHDQDFIDKIILDLARLDKIESDTGKRPPREELEKCILFNAELINDESHMWGDKASRTNLTKLMYRLEMIARHLFLGINYVFVNPNRPDMLIKEEITHEIFCQEWYHSKWQKNVCRYEIRDIRPGGTGAHKTLFLNPNEWLDIWDSYNIPTVVHDIELHLGGNKKARKTDGFNLQEAANNILKEKGELSHAR